MNAKYTKIKNNRDLLLDKLIDETVNFWQNKVDKTIKEYKDGLHMYSYGELLAKAKASNAFSKEEWFIIFQILFKISKQQFDIDWEYIRSGGL